MANYPLPQPRLEAGCSPVNALECVKKMKESSNTVVNVRIIISDMNIYEHINNQTYDVNCRDVLCFGLIRSFISPFFPCPPLYLPPPPLPRTFVQFSK